MTKTLKKQKNAADQQANYLLKLKRKLKKKVKMVNQLPKEVEEGQRRVKRRPKYVHNRFCIMSFNRLTKNVLIFINITGSVVRKRTRQTTSKKGRERGIRRRK